MTSTPTSSDVLLTRRDGSVLVVTLHRPERANALDPSLMAALRELWAEVADDDIRCVVLTGAGRAFCGGADISMLSQDRGEVGDTAADELAFLPGPRIAVPVIVAVNGACAGGGLHFVADADIAIAATTATFVDPHVSVGQVSALEPLELLRSTRRDAVVRLALLGRHEVLDADAARAAGLVSEVVAADDLLPRALQLAAWIAESSPPAVRATRRVLRADHADSATRMDLGWELIRRHRSHPDALEGPRAFAEKRAPKWSDS